MGEPDQIALLRSMIPIAVIVISATLGAPDASIAGIFTRHRRI